MAFFPSLKQNFIAYRSSKVSSHPGCIFEIHQLWQSGFSRVYSNSCCRCSFEPEIMKIGQSSHKMYCNNIVNFQDCTTILNASTKKYVNLVNAPRVYIYIYACMIVYIYIYIYIYMICVCVCVRERERERDRETEREREVYHFFCNLRYLKIENLTETDIYNKKEKRRKKKRIRLLN